MSRLHSHCWLEFTAWQLASRKPAAHPWPLPVCGAIWLWLLCLPLCSVRTSVVGDNLLRGVSGGEKKRVTIAESMAGGRAGLLLLDDYTKART